ncbi:MAG: hypothetical protein E7674_00415 [Ruminococcaceae bacterium]|nr:hypothetical protein [Oscillospiraceae bacterium]
MKPAEFLQNSIEHINDKYIAEAKEKRHKRSIFFKSIGLAAACLSALAILIPVSLHFALPSDISENSAELSLPPIDYTPIIINPTASPELLTGSPLVYLSGPSNPGGPDEEAPSMEFAFGGIIVKAELVNVLPDIYFLLDTSSYYQPLEYVLLQFRTIDVLSGKNVPKDFYYIMPKYLEVDFSPYDFFIISMSQFGFEDYVIKNGTDNVIETLPLTVFDASGEVYGNILAFTDGVFDESLWQNENWLFGYQFLKYYLDNPEYRSSYIAVKRGCDEQFTRNRIKEEIEKMKDYMGEKYKEPQVRTLDFTSEEVSDALEYVKPFENGVFSQTYNHPHLVYERFINGCYTGEYININVEEQKVESSSKIKYSAADLANMENISLQIAALAEQYKETFPTPPHITVTEDKKLSSLFIYGWYVKTEDGVYGVVKTVWTYYGNITTPDREYMARYYDETFILYDMSNSTAHAVTREELISVIGNHRHIYSGEYGVPEEVPME